MNDSSMFVVTHKTVDNRINLSGFKYIAVDPNVENVDCYDNTHDNIHDKNPYYCELTALYWIWRNIKDCDCVGLCHYRRFFVNKDANGGFVPVTLDELNSALVGHDIVLSESNIVPFSSNAYYESCVSNDALRKICKIIVDRDTSYNEAVNKILRGNSVHYYNMFYCKKELIDEYCSWLFPLLFDFESFVNMDGWTKYQQRLFGFLSEILLNVWVEKNKLDVSEFKVVLADTFPSNSAFKKRIDHTFKRILKILLLPFKKVTKTFFRINIVADKNNK